jgi:hypothetical protein
MSLCGPILDAQIKSPPGKPLFDRWNMTVLAQPVDEMGSDPDWLFDFRQGEHST